LSTNVSAVQKGELSAWTRIKRQLARDWQLYLFVLPGVIYYVIFHYLPLYGIQIAFKDYKAVQGIAGSAWVGLKHFKAFFSSYLCGTLILNTLLVNMYNLLFGFPIPILLSLLLNRVMAPKFKKFTQTVIYIPHFVSTVVMAGMLYIFLDPTNGVVNTLIAALGGTPQYFMAEPGWFRTVFIASGQWQNAGWGTIIYIAALTAIDQELYEAARIDGASILSQIFYIDLPSIIPMAMMMLILNSGQIMAGNMTKTLLLQTAGNKATSNTIGVYVYTMGLTSGQFSYTAAIGLFQNIISFIMVMSVNMISKKASSISMF
jgi:putative aldouronate transport system permease protein